MADELLKIVLSAQFHTDILYLPYVVEHLEVQGLLDCAAGQAYGEVVRQGGGARGARALSLSPLSGLRDAGWQAVMRVQVGSGRLTWLREKALYEHCLVPSFDEAQVAQLLAQLGHLQLRQARSLSVWLQCLHQTGGSCVMLPRGRGQ